MLRKGDLNGGFAVVVTGGLVEKGGRDQWSRVVWGKTKPKKIIAKMLLDHGANPDIRSSSGGTAYDFVQPGSDFSQYLHENGYHIGGASLADDFYDSGYAQDRFEEEMVENELKRRMLMKESAAN